MFYSTTLLSRDWQTSARMCCHLISTLRRRFRRRFQTPNYTRAGRRRLVPISPLTIVLRGSTAV